LKWTLIRRKGVSVIAALPTITAFVVVVVVIVAMGVILTSTGFTIAAIRQRSRRKRVLTDQCILPSGATSPSSYWNTVTRISAGTPVSVRENDLVVLDKSDTELGSLSTVPSIM
jgi:hypothetical protein